MSKVYTLPNLPPAPTSDLQSLLRRWFEYADFSAVLPILDCLIEEGRSKDRSLLLRWIKDHSYSCCRNENFKLFWADEGPGYNLLRLFWHDLFSLEGQLTQLSGTVSTETGYVMEDSDE